MQAVRVGSITVSGAAAPGGHGLEAMPLISGRMQYNCVIGLTANDFWNKCRHLCRPVPDDCDLYRLKASGRGSTAGGCRVKRGVPENDAVC